MNYDSADYRMVAEHFWHVPIAPATYWERWQGGWGTFLQMVPFRGIGLGTAYLVTGWLRVGHAPATVDEIHAAGVTMAALEKLALALALLALFEAVRRRWSSVIALIALALTAFPSEMWRLTDDFLVEPFERILFLLALACVVAMTHRATIERLGFVLAGIFLIAAQTKVQWSVGAFLLFPFVLWEFRRAGVSARTGAVLAAIVASIPLTVAAVNWIGWRTASLSPGIGLHVNLKSNGAVLRSYGDSLARQSSKPPFVDMHRPRVEWWNIYVGSDATLQDYEAFDRYARRWILARPGIALRSFWDGIGRASIVPGTQRYVRGLVRLEPLEGRLGSFVRLANLATWLLLLIGLRYDDTRLTCALALVLWIVPAIGNMFSLYELRYHMPMAGVGAVAASAVLAHLVRHRQPLRLLVASTAVQ